jgi:7-cyano-7-deazaguanine synthase in queuosine biosynthesis
MIHVVAHEPDGEHPIRLSPIDRRSGDGHFRWAVKSGTVRITNSVALDLLEVVKAIHLADRAVRRIRYLGSRMRHIRVKIPVRDPATWDAVADKLQGLATFVSADKWIFEFDGARRRIRQRKEDASPEIKYDGIALFSGGLDSLCGAAIKARNRERWLFVTHSPPGRKRTQQLLDATWAAFRNDSSSVDSVSFRLEVRERDSDGNRRMFPEPTRRTRPLFFLGLACALALDRGVPRIHMAENGALGLNLPYRYDAYGGTIARQAHVNMMNGFAALLKKLEPQCGDWRIENPLCEMTKGEACKQLRAAAHLAAHTISCEYTGRQAARVRNWKRLHPGLARRQQLGDGPQCGVCLPCIIRRSALRFARIPDDDRSYFFDARQARDWDDDPVSPLLLEPEKRPPLYDVVAPHVFYMRRFCHRLRNMRLTDFVIDFLPELRLTTNGTGSLQFDLMKRYAKEVLAFLEPR